MFVQVLDLLVKDLPFKKMPGFLKTQKINPDLIAISISDDGQKYVPINWKNFMPYGHKVVKIILCKMDNLFLYVGCSKDGETIIYNDGFSKSLLLKASGFENKIDLKGQKAKSNTLIHLDIILDKIGKFGIDSLSIEEKRELDFLSK